MDSDREVAKEHNARRCIVVARLSHLWGGLCGSDAVFVDNREWCAIH